MKFDHSMKRDDVRDNMRANVLRRLPIGAECGGNAVSFRVWAPQHDCVVVSVEGEAGLRKPWELPLEPEGNGYFSASSTEVQPGDLYRFRLDNNATPYPDPASRFQPEGPHGPSQVIVTGNFPWTDHAWRGVNRAANVVYELHVGTFSAAGTWQGAESQLADLADLGITIVELMPVSEFAGEFGWGYDGVNLFAPSHLYGSPDDFRRFVDRAHALGLGVILDVVYNHFGPDGNYLPQFSADYFTDRYQTDWGAAIDYDGPHAQAARELITTNARYWIDEYHLDGLRLDATQNIYDASATHIVCELTQAARAAAGPRSIFVVGENEEQDIRFVLAPELGGYGVDALWNDDLHHTAFVALSGHHEAYYSDYRGTPQEFVSAAKHGYLYQGQRYEWQNKNRGTSSRRVDPACFVTFLDNHDQVANSGQGLRCHQLAQPGRFRALTAYLLLGPGTPMLFQGQEFNASAPFLYFADHRTELAQLVRQGRHEFLRQFPSLSSPAMQHTLANPEARETFQRSKLDWSERTTHRTAVDMHRDLIRLRREDPLISNAARSFDGAVLTTEAFVLRFFADDGQDHLLLINLGIDQELFPIPEPLLAAPAGTTWSLHWSSEDPRYGGLGIAPLWKNQHLFLPGNSALLLVPAVAESETEVRAAQQKELPSCSALPMQP